MRRLFEWARFRIAVAEYARLRRKQQRQWNFEGNDD